tara:strand:+ start:431 stop:574 length:144 start_codon:yes stop_codon:yes gene_type:complete
MEQLLVVVVIFLESKKMGCVFLKEMQFVTLILEALELRLVLTKTVQL